MDKKVGDKYNTIKGVQTENAFSSSMHNLVYNLAVALFIVILTVISEYGFRHYVMFWFPVIGNLYVNDMISLFFAYILIIGGIVLLKQLDWQHELLEILQGLRYILTTRRGTVWVLVLVMGFRGFGLVDKIFLAKYALPMYLSLFRNTTVWLLGLAPLLEVISLLVVNGIFIPIAEEFLWRGLVQGYLNRSLRPTLSIALLPSFFHLSMYWLMHPLEDILLLLRLESYVVY